MGRGWPAMRSRHQEHNTQLSQADVHNGDSCKASRSPSLFRPSPLATHQARNANHERVARAHRVDDLHLPSGDAPLPPVTVYARDGERRVPARDVKVVDTVGAGDAFGGAFLAWWIASGLGRNELGDLDALQAAAEAANEVAAVTCERAGADPPTIAELTRPWNLWTAPGPRLIWQISPDS